MPRLRKHTPRITRATAPAAIAHPMTNPMSLPDDDVPERDAACWLSNKHAYVEYLRRLARRSTGVYLTSPNRIPSIFLVLVFSVLPEAVGAASQQAMTSLPCKVVVIFQINGCTHTTRTLPVFKPQVPRLVMEPLVEL